ncbi:hypothetical protein RRG08_029165 [Elysia crispata]|uniref:Uncharacterized protein n=1 Tax=Elysia crispata TaxID=231223 RepID=A0AAE1AKD0_9GAST|nr:hypothetical protein RRG08_029165 [Elysia crispata]
MIQASKYPTYQLSEQANLLVLYNDLDNHLYYHVVEIIAKISVSGLLATPGPRAAPAAVYSRVTRSSDYSSDVALVSPVMSASPRPSHILPHLATPCLITEHLRQPHKHPGSQVRLWVFSE